MPQPATAAPTERNINRYSVPLVCSSSFAPAANCPGFSAPRTAVSWANTGSRNFVKWSEPPRLCGQPSHPAMTAPAEDDQRDGHGFRRLVNVMLDLVAHPRATMKGEEHQTEHIEGGHQGSDVTNQPQQAIGAAFGRPGLPEDCVLGEKSSEGRNSGDG